jgi:hypothetical protein
MPDAVLPLRIDWASSKMASATASIPENKLAASYVMASAYR